MSKNKKKKLKKKEKQKQKMLELTQQQIQTIQSIAQTNRIIKLQTKHFIEEEQNHLLIVFRTVLFVFLFE